MKTTYFLPHLFASALVLSSCSSFKTSPEDINEFANKQQYDQAIAQYQQLSDEDKTNIDLGALQQKREDYEKTNINYIKQLQQKKQFEQARDQLAKAQQNIPSSEALKKLQEEQNSIEQQHEKKYQLQYDKILADFYLKEAPLIQQLAKTENGKSYQQLLQTREQDIAKTANNLGENGLQAYSDKNSTEAKRLLTLANKLQPTQQWQDALTSMAKTKKKKQTVARKKAAKKTTSQLEKLQAVYHQKFAQSAWLDARTTLEKIGKLKLNKKEKTWFSNEKSRLKNITDSIAAEKNKRGKVLYSKGNIAKALDSWNEGLQYAPNNQEIKDNIERAEKFQQKFNSLKK